MTRLPATTFRCEPCPENPGWQTWDSLDPLRFNGSAMGKLIVRLDDPVTARLRMFPERRHANLPGSVHGGVTLALVDVALFASLWVISGGDSAGAVTLEVTTQFIGAGELEEPLDAVCEMLKETRRLAFMRGKVVQGDRLVAAFTGTMRKASPKA